MVQGTRPAARELALALVTVVAMSLTTTVARASSDDFIAKKSAHDVPTTMDKLESVVAEKGIIVLARVDHGENASNVGMTLRPTQLLIFGNPKLGTQLMEIDQRVGVDLPMKVLVWQDKDGQTWLGYTDPEEIAERFGIDEDHAVIQTMRKALAGITDAAAN